MTATVTYLTQAKRLRYQIKRAMGLKPLAKCEPELPYEDPDVELYIGAAGEWLTCQQCLRDIQPHQTCQQDLVSGRTWCADCWPITE